MSDNDFPAVEPANNGISADTGTRAITDIEANLKPDEREFPLPTRAFTNKLVRTEDEIWVKLLQLDHAGEAHTETDWRGILASMKQREV